MKKYPERGGHLIPDMKSEFFALKLMLYFLGNKYYDLTLKFVQIYEFLSIKVYFFYNF